MAAFYHETNTTQRVDNGTGYKLLGQIELEPGEYLVWAKFSIGASAGSTPAWPHAGGHGVLAYGDHYDGSYVSVKPESGSNNETVALLTAGKASATRRARLYFANPYPVPLYVNMARIVALRVDGLITSIVGETFDSASVLSPVGSDANSRSSDGRSDGSHLWIVRSASLPIPGNFSTSFDPALDSPATYATSNAGCVAHRRSTSPPPYPLTPTIPTRIPMA